MFKCTGRCTSCGRCNNAALSKEAAGRKTKLLIFPEDFKPDGIGTGLGVAFDIGTTTVVGVLWNLENGLQLAAEARTNPQCANGSDVISRITYCTEEEGNTEKLRREILNCINEITETLCAKSGKSADYIARATVCGNTTMSHIFAGYSPASLAFAPFAPAYTGTLRMKGKEAGLAMAPEGEVTLIPNIAGHIGGDITAGIVATRLADTKGTTVFIDIGTNGEIVLTDGNKAFACSTAAGPALEGASIRCGMRAAPGAIEKIAINDGEVFFRTVEGDDSGFTLPAGICGSGIIDAIAQMLDARLIDGSGRLAAADEAGEKGFDPRLGERLTEIDGERVFVVVAGEGREDIVITQRDIREVQLVKGAIRAGVQLLLRSIGREERDIDRVIVAGAFGNYIDKESAVRIGLLPQVPTGKIILAGNTAGAGISMALMSDREMELAEKIPSVVEHVELAEKQEFQDVYIGALGF